MHTLIFFIFETALILVDTLTATLTNIFKLIRYKIQKINGLAQFLLGIVAINCKPIKKIIF